MFSVYASLSSVGHLVLLVWRGGLSRLHGTVFEGSFFPAALMQSRSELPCRLSPLDAVAVGARGITNYAHCFNSHALHLLVIDSY